MGMLAGIRGRYVVRVCGVRPGFPKQRFRRLDDAVVYADYLASSIPGAMCWISRVPGGAVVYRAGQSGGQPPPHDGTGGVREPRRPIPRSSAGSIALDLPE